MLASLAATFFAGVLTFASPCILPLAPVYLSILGGSAAEGEAEGREANKLRRAGVGFAIGLGLIFVALGMSASVFSGALSAHRGALLEAGGVLMVLFGLKLTGLLRMARLDGEARPLLQRLPAIGGFRGGLLFGAAFAVGWTPCVGPVLGSVLTYTAAQNADLLTSASYLGAYAAGLSLPLVAASLAAPAVLPLLRRARAHMTVAQRATGVVLLAVGALMMTDRLAWLAPRTDATAPTATLAAEAAPGAPGASCHGACACDGAARGCETNLSEGAPPAGSAALGGSPQLVEFVSGHCSVCAKTAPIVREVEKRCAAHGGTIAKIDVERPEGSALAARYAVRVVPTFLVIDAEGREVERLVGEQEIDRLQRAVEETRGARCAASL